jgi:hypothetical protein
MGLYVPENLSRSNRESNPEYPNFVPVVRRCTEREDKLEGMEKKVL